MEKNVPNQKWTVFAFGGNNHSTPGDPVTGDAANITAQLSQDGGALAAFTDVNPVELGGGYYEFDVTQAESNANKLTNVPASATADVLVIGVPGVIYTTPANFPATVISAGGNVDARMAANVTHGGGNQTRMLIDNSGGTGDASRFVAGTGGTGMVTQGEGAGNGSNHIAGATGNGLLCEGEIGIYGRGHTTAGIYGHGWAGTANGIQGQGDNTGAGALLQGDVLAGSGPGLQVNPAATSGVPIDYDGEDLLVAVWTHDQAGRLMEGARQLRPFTVGAAPSASTIPTNITGAPFTTVDHYAGRVVTINEETQTIIGSSGSPVVLTVTDFASVPSQNDPGVIS